MRETDVTLATGLGYHCLTWGADDPARDHTVVLVHGFLDLSWGWASTVEAGLGDKFHVVAPSMRGHGDSDRIGPGGYYYFFDYIADLRSLIEQVGRERVSLVGHSMGGAIVSYYAGTYPAEVERLVIMEGLGPPERTGTYPGRVRAWTEAWKRARQKTPRRYESVAAAAERMRKFDPLLSEETALFLAEHGTREVEARSPSFETAPSGPASDERLSGAREFKHDPLHVTRGPYPFRVDVATEFWNQITCPVLYIEGGESTFRRPEAEGHLAQFTAAASVDRLTLDGAGHMMQRHQPLALAGALSEFLAASESS